MATYNDFKSTTIRGTFNNKDYANGSILASGNFQRNLSIGGDLYLGTETSTTDASGNITYTDTSGNIYFQINGVQYSLTPTKLKYLSSITTDMTNYALINTANTFTQNQTISSLTVPSSGMFYFNGKFNLTNAGVTTYISAIELAYLDNASSNIQTQLNNITTNYSTTTATNTLISTAIANAGSVTGVKLSDTNVWTALNTFNTVPQCISDPALGEDLVRKSYFETTINSNCGFLGGSNNWLGTNVFDTPVYFNSGIVMGAFGNMISGTEFFCLSGITSNIQSQLNTISNNLSTNYSLTPTVYDGAFVMRSANSNFIITHNLNRTLTNPPTVRIFCSTSATQTFTNTFEVTNYSYNHITTTVNTTAFYSINHISANMLSIHTPTANWAYNNSTGTHVSLTSFPNCYIKVTCY